jgi:hypothetical protein
MEGWPRRPTLTSDAVHDLGHGRLSTVVAPLDRHARALERGHAGGPAQTLGSRRRQQALACRHPVSRARLSGPTAGRLVERVGGHAG